jgi:hypothetical protein
MPGLPKQIIVDFTNVRDASGYSQTHVKPGDYRGKIKSVEFGESKQNKTPMLTYALALFDRPSATYRYNCPLTEASFWKLRNLLVAAGVNVPKKKVNIASIAERIVGKEVGMSLEDEEYKDQVRSQVVQVFSADDLPANVPADEDEPEADSEDVPDDEAPATDEGEEDLEELDLDEI